MPTAYGCTALNYYSSDSQCMYSYILVAIICNEPLSIILSRSANINIDQTIFNMQRMPPYGVWP